MPRCGRSLACWAAAAADVCSEIADAAISALGLRLIDARRCCEIFKYRHTGNSAVGCQSVNAFNNAATRSQAVAEIAGRTELEILQVAI